MTSTMMKTLRSICVVTYTASLLLLSGCASFHVTILDSDPIQLEHQHSEYVTKTMHAFFWDLVLDPQVFAAECKGQGINDVAIDHNLAHDFSGVLTLGLWMPKNYASAARHHL